MPSRTGRRRAQLIGRCALSALIVAALALDACSSSSGSAGKNASSGVPGGSESSAGAESTQGADGSDSKPDVAPAIGTANVSVGPTVTTLAVQLCIQTPGNGLNVTAQGPSTPPETLTLNVTAPITGSTLVYTTRKDDDSFVTHSMAPSSSTQGSVDGLRVRVAGNAVQQAYTRTGKPQGKATSEAVTVDATCQRIQPPNPAPQIATTSPPTTKSSR